MRRTCPQWFQDRLAMLGLNPYGEPVFKLVWGESETMRVGGHYMGDGFEGYRDAPAMGGEAAWMLTMWEPKERFGSAYRWYKDYRNEDTGLSLLGEYPFKGRYRLLRKFIHREMIDGVLVTTRMEPTHFILDVMIPLLRAWLRLSDEQKYEHIQQEQAEQEREFDRVAKDALHAAKIRRDSPLVQKRLELMERTMGQAMAIASRTQLGLMQIGA